MNDPRFGRRRLMALGLAMPALATSAGAAGGATHPPLADGIIDLAGFGFAGDWDSATRRGTDDTAAWRQAIAVATERRIGTIRIPWGKTGYSRVSGSIVDGPLESGLTFEAEKPVGPGGQAGVNLVYTGSGTCWRIDHRGRGGSAGGWTFRGLGFRTLDGRATMFDFNDVLKHGLVRDEDPARFSAIENVRFESCQFVGAGAGTEQTGDAIRGAKLFHLVVDEHCFIRDFRRGVWLYGCDNSTIAVRSFLCARNVMIEASGTFGNDNVVTSRFLGGSPGAASETVYFLWDNANSTAVHETYFEELDQRRAEALMYLDGYETLLLRPHFAGKPAFRLGPHGREITMLSPAITRYVAEDRPLFDRPASWDFGFEQSDYRLTIVAGTKNVQLTFGVHPRLRWVGQTPIGAQASVAVPVSFESDLLAGPNGAAPRQRLLSALNWWSRSTGTAATGGIADMVRDPSASSGWAVKLDPATRQGGFCVQLAVGRDVFPAERLKVRIRARTPDATGWFSVITRSGRGFVRPVPLPAGGAGYAVVDHIVDLTGWQVGDTLEHVVYQGERPGQPVLLDYVSYIREET